MRRKKLTSVLLAALLPALLLLSACGGGSAALSPLSAAFLKVGKADAIVLTCGGETLVIDTGETDDGEEVLSFLSSQNVSAVDALIITHFDQDHVGGAAALLAGVEVKRILTPAYDADSAEYQSFIAALATAGKTAERLTESSSFTVGDAEVLVEPPLSYEIAGSSDDADNDLSLITTVTHGSVRLLFTGDAENDRLTEWLQNGTVRTCDLVKIPHHGSYHKALKDLLAAVSPAYAVICDSEKNPAEDKTAALLAQRQVTVFETKDGNVLAESDGKKLTVTQS